MDLKISKNTKKQTGTRNKRSNIALEEDLKKYKEILSRDQALENDIPPKRTLIKQEESEDLLNIKIEPLRTLRTLRSSIKSNKIGYGYGYGNGNANGNGNGNVEKNIKSKLKRPSFVTEQKQHQGKYNRYKNSKSLPPTLCNIHPKTLEDSVSLSHTYQGLIKIIKNNMSNENDIDIPMHHRLLPKNLSEEYSRFSLQGTNDFSELNVINSNIFQSGDIDLFFESLNENTTSSYKEFIMNNIPLA